MASPIVAIGEVTNIVFYGEQTVDRLPPPTMLDVHELYWCVGDFHATAVVKGESVPTKKLLWASTIPGCKLLPDNPNHVANRSKTRAWLLREEGEFLRPTFDYGAHRFLGVFTRWEDDPTLPPRQHLGSLLLTPSANADTLDNYADYFWDVVDIACELLGREECVRRIRDLAALGDPKLRESACGCLKGQWKEQYDCDSK